MNLWDNGVSQRKVSLAFPFCNTTQTFCYEYKWLKIAHIDSSKSYSSSPFKTPNILMCETAVYVSQRKVFDIFSFKTHNIWTCETTVHVSLTHLPIL